MNVHELIAALQAVEDKALPVSAEACDCINPVSAVSVEAAETGFLPTPAHVLIKVQI